MQGYRYKFCIIIHLSSIYITHLLTQEENLFLTCILKWSFAECTSLIHLCLNTTCVNDLHSYSNTTDKTYIYTYMWHHPRFLSSWESLDQTCKLSTLREHPLWRVNMWSLGYEQSNTVKQFCVPRVSMSVTQWEKLTTLIIFQIAKAGVGGTQTPWFYFVHLFSYPFTLLMSFMLVLFTSPVAALFLL